MKTKLDNLINETLFQFGENYNPNDYIMYLKIDGDPVKRRLNAKEIAWQVQRETRCGLFLKDILVEAVCGIIKMQGVILKKVSGEEKENLDILHELVTETPFGNNFNERIVSLAVLVFFGSFIKIKKRKTAIWHRRKSESFI